MRTLLSLLRLNHVHVKLIDGELRVIFPKGKVDQVLLEEIRLHKAGLIDYLSRLDKFQYSDIPAIGNRDHYVLSSSQRRMYILSQIEEGSIAYHIPGVYVLEGEVDRVGMEESLRALVERHESLRTVFREDGQGEIRQYIEEPDAIGFAVEHVDLRNEERVEEEVRELVRSACSRPFDLGTGPLLRAHLYQLADRKWVFCFVMHHIICDGWSVGILIRELLSVYNAHERGIVHPLSPLRIQYKDYASWQQEQLSGPEYQAHKSYWLDQFRGVLPVLELPSDRVRPAVRSYGGGLVSRMLDGVVSRGIGEVSRESGGTLYMGLLAAVNVLLYRYTGQEEIITGSPIAGREHIDLEGQLGLYINTLALRIRFKGEDSFRELLDRVKEVALSGYKHQSYPFDELVDELGLQRDMSRHPLFDVMVVLQNTDSLQSEGEGGLEKLTVSKYQGVEQVVSKFDLVFAFSEVGEELRAGIEYNSDIYTEHTVKRMLDHLEQLLSAIVADPGVAVGRLDYLGTGERERLLAFFEPGEVAYPREKTIVELFEEQAAMTPDNIAVVCGDRRLSYAALNECSNRLGRYLRDRYSIGPDDLIGIRLGRTEEMVISILGVLKSGGAYVPIDPAYPEDRIAYMVSDSGCKVVIDEQELERFGVERDKYDRSNPAAVNVAGDLAYVIYTSGTTGRPKGSLVEHRNVVRLFRNDRPLFDFGVKDVWTLFHSYCFDFSVWEMYGALLHGGRLVVVGLETARDAGLYRELLDREGVTVLNQTPSAFYALQKEEEEREEAGLRVRYVIFGGEALSPGKLGPWRRRYPEARLINMYGITETTVHVTYKEIGEEEIGTNSSNIGRPIPTLSCYVLDSHRQLVPVGVWGELYVGGEGVCRGYLNREELTGARFVMHPFRAGERLYRSGDKVKVLENGELEYGGRMDEQVKIRGYRIELGEIEHALLRNEKIREAVVIARADGNGEQSLVAYVVSREALNIGDVRMGLSRELPGYQIPGQFMQLEKMPLTSNGKVDKKNLPVAEGAGMETGVTYVGPRTETEERLVVIWQEVLGRDRIGVKDNFFDLGGHSLKATRLASQIYKAFNVKAGLKDLFIHAVLEDLAHWIQQTVNTAFVSIVPAAVQSSYALSSSQHRLWILSQFQAGNIAYNIPGVYVLEGNLDLAALEHSFKSLIERHEILRTVFRKDGQGEVRQFIQFSGETEFAITCRDLREEDRLEEKLRSYVQDEFSKPFDLRAGPLLRAHLYRLEDQKWVLCYVMHHIVSDGWSLEIMIRELLLFYNAYINGEPDSLTTLRIHYKDYAAWQLKRLKEESFEAHKSYWLQQLEGELPVLELTGGKARPAVRSYAGGVIKRTLDPGVSKGIRQVSQQQGGTLFMRLLAAVNVLLYRYTGQEDIIIGSPVAGREHVDLENQLGCYLNTLALRIRFKGEDSFEDLLENVRHVTLDAYEHQAYPFDDLVNELHLRRDMSRHPLFDVMVVVQDTDNHVSKKAQYTEKLKVNRYAGGEQVVSKFDMEFTFIGTDESIRMDIAYNSDIYSKSKIEGLSMHLERLMAAIVEHPSESICRLVYLSTTEKRQLLDGFNDTSAAYREDQTITSLFEEQASKTPDRVALIFRDKEFSYRELDERSNQLARYLRERYGIKADDLIGIKLERSERMIISMLAVLKAGGAYVPIDPEYPQDRIEYIMADSSCKALIDVDELEKFDKEEMLYGRERVPGINTSRDLMYVIYTSGSTGKPKGCMLEHRGVVNRLEWMWRHYGFGPDDVILQKTTFTFDVSVWEVFMPLSWGCKMVLCEREDVASPARILSLIERHRVTCLHFVPSMLHAFIPFLSADEDLHYRLRSLQRVITSGEALPVETVRSWYNKVAVPIHNLYGPTEASVDVTYYATSPQDIRIPIGRPIWNTRIYITDRAGQLLPIGVTGEISIGGDGVARGYLNRPDLTAEKFAVDPFKGGGRIYKTGDLGRWLPDGNIEFAGRGDDQVKIRGYRIELGEIEHALRNHAGVESAVVLALADANGDKTLTAYIAGKTTLNMSDIRTSLSKVLPSYMIPGHLVQLKELPLTANGKIDKSRLPDQRSIGVQTTRAIVEPRNETEEKLVMIWKEVLGIERVGITDSFFELGGHSINLMRLITRIENVFEISYGIEQLFRNPTIEYVSNEIDKAAWANTDFASVENVNDIEKISV